MGLQAAEITLNFILNLYRPRIPGEVQRPAFDSKGLSLLAAPDNIVRSLNEAVNYQFGFDVTSSWGYQLLLRSLASLVALGVIALVLLSTMVVVEPHQQAIRLRGGAMVRDEVYRSGIMWKRPWPLETAQVYDVSRLRSLWLTAKVVENRPVNLWFRTSRPRLTSMFSRSSSRRPWISGLLPPCPGFCRPCRRRCLQRPCLYSRLPLAIRRPASRLRPPTSQLRPSAPCIRWSRPRSFCSIASRPMGACWITFDSRMTTSRACRR